MRSGMSGVFGMIVVENQCVVPAEYPISVDTPTNDYTQLSKIHVSDTLHRFKLLGSLSLPFLCCSYFMFSQELPVCF